MSTKQNLPECLLSIDNIYPRLLSGLVKKEVFIHQKTRGTTRLCHAPHFFYNKKNFT
jgi:hypothetical protein